MHRLNVMLALLLLAACGVTLAGAAGVGTFSIEQTTVNVGVDQFGVATLYMDNTWDPPADSAILHLGWDPAVIQYVSADWRVGNSVSATLNAPGDLTLSFADWTNKYPSGRVPIVDINFRGVAAGQTTLGIRIDSVRSHVGVSPTEFTELTASSLSNPGIFTVGQGGGGAVTTVPTIPGEPTGTIAPTMTGTVIPTVPPIGTVTGNVTGGVTTPITIMTTVPTGITTGVPVVPPQGSTGGSEEYTGVVTRTATATPTTTTTATGTATPTATATMGGEETPGATPTMTPDGGNVTVTMTTGMNVTTGTAGATGTPTAFETTPAGTTTARTTAPVNTTATATGVDALPLAVAGLAALALIAARRR